MYPINRAGLWNKSLWKPVWERRFFRVMQAPWRKKQKRFTYGKKKGFSLWRNDASGRQVFNVAIFVLLVSFVGGSISTYIMYRKSLDQVFDTRVEHVRNASAYLARILDADAQQEIAKAGSKKSKAYLSTQKTIKNFLHSYPNALRAYTLEIRGNSAYYLVDATQYRKSVPLQPTQDVNQILKTHPAELFKSNKKVVPTVERVTKTGPMGMYVTGYRPLVGKDGKVKAILAVDMQFGGFQADRDALFGALEYGIYATAIVAVLLALFSVAFLWASHRDNLVLTAEMIEQRKKLSKTEAELLEAMNASEEISGSLISTLSNAGCLVWNGKAWKTNEGMIWKAGLKYEPHFDWLANDLAKDGVSFEQAWDKRRNPEDRLVWEKLLGFAFDGKLSSLTSEYRLNTDTEELWFEEQLDFDYEPDGSVSIHGFVRDVTEPKRRNDEIRRLAYYDTITGLINRTRIHDVMNELLEKSHQISVIGIEIGNFRNVNESWGAEVADKLLHEFGQQLSEGVGTNGIVGHLAGDDFVVIVPEDSTMSWLVGRVDEICQKPTYIDGVEIAKVCRMGFVSSVDGDNAATLLRKINLALENARKNLTNYPVAYKPEMSFKAKMRVELETAMRQALIDREFYLMFQPIYCNKTKKLVKAEALLRWNSSRFGPVSPGTFIPIAEESDFINDLGNFVIDEAARAIASFAQQTRDSKIVISLNMSLRQLKNQSTLNVFHSALDKWGISQKNMLIEITESSIMHDSGECVSMLTQLQERGFSLAIDDFGTGYSSLATLASLPFNCLKIDKKFVDGIGVDRKQEEVLGTIVRLARALNLQIVAEGIESEAQYVFLANLGVEYSQGFYFARPLPFEDLVARAVGEAQKAA